MVDDATELAFSLQNEIRKTLPPESRVAIAFSGGMDSTVAACCVRAAIGEERAVLVHFNFGPYTYQKTAENVKSLSRRIGLPLILIDKQKEIEAVSRKGPSCNLCTKRVKLGGMMAFANEHRADWIISGANQSDTWGQYGIPIHRNTYSPLFHLNKPEIRVMLEYFGFTLGDVRSGESALREGCKLKHLMKAMAVPEYHGKAVCLSNEMLLSRLREEQVDSEFANVKIIGPLGRNIALINAFPLPPIPLRKRLVAEIATLDEISEAAFVDRPVTLYLKANPGLFRSQHSRYWLEAGKIQPEFSEQLRFVWMESPNRSLKTYHAVDYSFV